MYGEPIRLLKPTRPQKNEIEINVGLKLKLKNNKVYGEVTIKKESLKLTCYKTVKEITLSTKNCLGSHIKPQ